MRFPCVAVALVALVAAVGCADPAASQRVAGDEAELFVAHDAKLHPVFTKIADFDADGNVDGIDALVELHDQFGDTTKGAGTFTFELYGLKLGQPDPRGPRLSNPWQVDVLTPAQQRERWSRASRCYTFRLQAANLSRAASYVLTVTYAPAGGGPRSFDRIVLAAVPGITDAPVGSSGSSVDTTGGTAPTPGPQGSIDSLPPR